MRTINVPLTERQIEHLLTLMRAGKGDKTVVFKGGRDTFTGLETHALVQHLKDVRDTHERQPTQSPPDGGPSSTGG